MCLNTVDLKLKREAVGGMGGEEEQGSAGAGARGGMRGGWEGVMDGREGEGRRQQERTSVDETKDL